MERKIFEEIKGIISDNEVVLFMKGSANMPRCGFSKFVVDLLKGHKVNFKDIDILKDEEMRQAIKEYTNWPTIPQLYVNGSFVGGCDIVEQLYQQGDFQSLFSKNL